MSEKIEILGIETNNLKNIDVSLEKGGINLIVGPSGSGKSSLAYDTIAQIGQYEFMSMFADNCVEPNYRVKSYSNMIAAVPIKQTNYNSNMRSTIGTYFGLNKAIALLYSVITGADRELFILNKEENLCPECHGLGNVKQLDLNKMVDFNIPLYKNPFRCWDRYKEFYAQIIEKFCAASKIDSRKTFRELNDKEIHTLLYGESSEKYSVKYKKVNRLASRTTKYYGVCTDHPMMPEFSVSKKFYSDIECPACHGKRYSSLNEEYKLNGLTIGQFMTTPFSDLIEVIKSIDKKNKDERLKFSIAGLMSFVNMAIENNLGHLYLNRSIPTLSGGELQRLRLVQVFNTQLSNLLIVLDEPLAGLSGEERKAIYNNVVRLSKQHTVVIVDHSDIFVSKAKKVIALGEKGGIYGGNLIDANAYIAKQKKTYSFDVVSPKKQISVEKSSKIYNYQGVKLSIGENAMNLVYGRSGIGKSTLLREYFPQIFEKYSYINQKPLFGNKSSSVATLLDILGKTTEIYAKKYKKDKTFFSNQKGCEGSCPSCCGAGYLEYTSDADNKIIIECKDCHGTGFHPQLAKYRINEKSLFDIWNMTIDEAVDYYDEVDKTISTKLRNASSLLLGHLMIGQPTSSLSGGENIRIKLLKELKSKADIVGIDEPFKGLGSDEIFAVTQFLEKLRNEGKTIVVIDHTESAFKYFAQKIELQVKNGILCS